MSEWVSAREALERLLKADPSHGDREVAVAAIVASAEAGTVRARAASARGERRNRRQIEILGEHENWDVPLALWRTASINTRQDLGAWQAGTIRFGPGVAFFGDNWVLGGVEFNRSELDRALPALSTGHPVEPPSPVRHGTGRPRKAEWNDWIAHVVLTVYRGELTGTLTDSQALKVVAESMARMGLDELSRSTVQAAMTAVLHALRREDAQN